MKGEIKIIEKGRRDKGYRKRKERETLWKKEDRRRKQRKK
jgi:hypothetical protein